MTLIVANFAIQPPNLLTFIPLSATQITNLLVTHPDTGLHRFVMQFCNDHNFSTQDQILFLLSGMKPLRDVDKAQYKTNLQALFHVQFDIEQHINKVNMDVQPTKNLHLHFHVLGVYWIPYLLSHLI